MQAIILAAGMGKRLKQLTNNNTKCMVKVNGVTMIERMLSQLDKLNLSNITVVVGYKGKELQEYISTLNIKTKINYVENEIYDKTNNIYSLYLARHCLLQEDTLLLESDLIFEDSVLEKIVNDPYPSLALVAKYESWMDGTVVTLDEENNITRFLDKKAFKFEDIQNYYKTVNIYKFSKEFSTSHYVPFLEAYSKALGDNEYYEQVLKVITLLDKPEIKATKLGNESWYEIDDLQDLDIAESIFAPTADEKLAKIQARYGGYWRYPGVIDFCYLVNPFYPPQKLMNEIKANFETLLCEYPSGLEVNSLLAAKYFGLNKEHVVVGNGAAELIKSLMERGEGKIGMAMPTFQEYPNRKSAEDVVPYYPNNKDYAYTAMDLMSFYEDKDISTLLLINPDNPSGNYICKDDVLKLARWAQNKNITFIVDESFVDFADKEESPTLLEDSILNDYPELIIVKSISKSFGVPGLRLGILASHNTKLISELKKDVAIWNINSFGEFYMQIFEKYKGDYTTAIEKFKEVRREYLEELSNVKNLRVVPTQANYVLCEILGDNTAYDITKRLLDEYDVFIKDLSSKKGFNGQYIRIAVKRPEENRKLVEALKTILE
ncbi:MAG: aminotransferase class I/II-fold pyridoxal phosphate-dependent enzyme [Clostridium sp.]|uniref:aminotransferase class I/II-fold pyridoxal phosphate-dependent enzyme n=1 Tax=Clostridium TaxID=1485 RepID=UPI00232EFA0C|nr:MULTISPECIES: aminotransferase class I/II-fold pyridoxal phosphate-dependent enzyme [Clostridium]MDB2119332.1 aminotransferase class I/II-fold pyridoxal phosphate-dependent enzyme [Clostridium paraputrificum]MDU2754887.1 aminotransferase class I/II-fold pyridoxal phosphate-dependent enzyme [Clostridium sp.]MDU2900684.1 aminotransferase class I/II-fold pyridoxal phosphate-dependent enzyme [Clostridium sp.]MDU4427808.1 aminotransferase class I/II-fold pyridoxal phosphate-dependent enzyme [Clos